MSKGKYLIIIGMILSAVSCGEGFSWKRTLMDGSRTGVEACTADNVSEKLGTYSDGVYTAPNGKVFSDGCTPEVARILLEAQPAMADLKTVVGHSTRAMVREYPQCELSNWFIDALMKATEQKAGKKVHFGLTNFGGIRVDMPEGDVLKDDIVSMFPFKNNICYLELKGSDIRLILERLAASSWQVVGGGKFVVKDGKLESAEIDGAPLDDERVYGVATISFLLNGGDDIFMARNARRLEIFDEYILDVMLPYVESLTAQGLPIEYHTDDRITIINTKDDESFRK